MLFQTYPKDSYGQPCTQTFVVQSFPCLGEQFGSQLVGGTESSHPVVGVVASLYTRSFNCEPNHSSPLADFFLVYFWESFSSQPKGQIFSIYCTSPSSFCPQPCVKGGGPKAPHRLFVGKVFATFAAHSCKSKWNRLGHTEVHILVAQPHLTTNILAFLSWPDRTRWVTSTTSIS